jgi:hypothetical protein
VRHEEGKNAVLGQFEDWHCDCYCKKRSHTNHNNMARKLYIFNPTARVRTDGKLNSPRKWLGGFTTSYTYLGDYYARLLGVGNHLSVKPIPAWLHTQAAAKFAKGGASRLDRNFRGWG